MTHESFHDFLIRLGFESGQHVGSSSSYHYGTPIPTGKYSVLYPIRVDWSPSRGPMRAFFFTVWFLGMLAFDGPGEPDRAMIEQLVKESS